MSPTGRTRWRAPTGFLGLPYEGREKGRDEGAAGPDPAAPNPLVSQSVVVLQSAFYCRSTSGK
jgi:hypothetical protein